MSDSTSSHPAVLSDTEDDPSSAIEDEEEELRFQESIKKDLFSEFNTTTPMKMARESISHNREHMKVYLRVRPFTNMEVEEGESQDCFVLENNSTMIMKAPKNSFTFKSSQRGFGDMNHRFTFSKIFKEDTSQKLFFDETMMSTVKDFIDGQNCLVFTYGVTNAGKTYTIQGVPQDGGILPRTLDVLFNSIEDRQFNSMKLKPRYFCDVVKLSEKQQKKEEDTKLSVLAVGMTIPAAGDQTTILEGESMTDDSLNTDLSRASYSTTTEDSRDASELPDVSKLGGRDSDGPSNQTLLDEIRARIPDNTSVDIEAQGPIKFTIWVSFAEIYNEYIYDLLEPLPKGKKVRRQTLKLAEDKNGHIYIKGLKEIQVSTADEAYRILKIGQRNLSIAATKLNHCSSRSHCIFSIKILRVVDVNDPHVARVSKLSFCDLAGSERYTRTQNTGDRLKEAGNINTSLLTLGKCIHALRYNQNHPKAHPKIIPFRESKLTRLFQSFFLGKGKASMIVNINQCASGFDETMHVLKFSAIAKQVTTVTSKLDNKWKEPPKQPTRPARNVSLALNQALTHKVRGQRPSVPWATPGTIAQVMRETGHMSSIETVTEDEEEDIEEEEEEEVEEVDTDAGDTPVPKGDVVSASKIQKELLAVIDVLKQKLVEERMANINLESKIREEVCQEMAEQLVEIEQDYNERLEEEKMLQEEVFEKRLEIYAQSVKMSRKRARTDADNDQDDQASTMLLAAQEENSKLQSEVEDQKKVIADLTSQVTTLNEQLQTNEVMRTELEEAQGSVESEVEDQKKVIADLTSQVTTLKDQLQTTDDIKKKLEEAQVSVEMQLNMEEHETLVSDLRKQLVTLKEELQLVESLQRQLEEANHSLEERDAKIADLSGQITQQEEQNTAEESGQNKLFQDMMSKLEESTKAGTAKDTRIEELEKELAGLEEKLKLTEEVYTSKMVSEMGEHEKVIQEYEEQVECLAAVRKELVEVQNKLTEREGEIEVLKTSAAEQESTTETLTNKMNAEIQECKKNICDLEQHVASLEGVKTQLEDAEKELRLRDTKIEELTAIAADEKKELTSHEEALERKIEELNTVVTNQTEKLEASERSHEVHEEELEASKQQLMQQIEELKAVVANQTETFQSSEKTHVAHEQELEASKEQLTQQMSSELEKQEHLVHDLEERLESLGGVEKQLEEAKKEIEERDTQIEDLYNQLEESKKKISEAEEKLTTQLCAELKSHEEAQHKMRTTILEGAQRETETKQLMEEQEGTLEELKVIVERQQEQIERMEAAAEDKEKQIAEMESKLAASKPVTDTEEKTSQTDESDVSSVGFTSSSASEDNSDEASRKMTTVSSTTSLASVTSNEDEDDDVILIEPEDQEGYKAGRLSRVEIDATPLQKKRKTRATRATRANTRASKRGVEEENSEAVSSKRAKGDGTHSTAPKTRGRSRRGTRASSKLDLTEEIENQPAEGKSPSTTSNSGSSQRRGPLARINEILQNSPLGKSVYETAKRLVDSATGAASPAEEVVKPPSPPRAIEMTTMAGQPEPKRRKRKLYKTDISAPYECSPFEIVNLGEAKPVDSSHAVITRKLRSRSKKN